MACGSGISRGYGWAGLGCAGGGRGLPVLRIRWGSLAKDAGNLSKAQLVGVRAGRHGCFDRLVVDFKGHSNGYRVEYVSQVREDGSGRLVPLRGGARLQIVASN